MSINVSGNILSSTGFTPSGEITNTPNIVTDGLVLWYDAGNNASYNNSSTYYDCGYGCQYYGSNPGCTNCNTQIKDMSGYGHDGAFNGGMTVTYTGATGGSLLLTGSEYTVATNTSFMNFSSGQTICMWLKPTSDTTQRRNPYNQAYGGPGTITYEPATNLNYFFGTNGGDSTPYVGVTSGFNLSSTDVNFISVTRSQSLDVCKWYHNGVLYTDTNAGGYTTTANGTANIQIGYGYTGYAFLGNIYVVLVYNKYLTQSEIVQNFNADRSRFGI